MDALVISPIAAAVDAASIHSYRSGVMRSGKSVAISHGIIIVGYGSEKNLADGLMDDYWLVKNSWGRTWGEKGYFKLSRK